MGDWCQIGNHPGARNERYISHLDTFGETPWFKNTNAAHWRPTTYFYALGDRTIDLNLEISDVRFKYMYPGGHQGSNYYNLHLTSRDQMLGMMYCDGGWAKGTSRKATLTRIGKGNGIEGTWSVSMPSCRGRQVTLLRIEGRCVTGNMETSEISGAVGGAGLDWPAEWNGKEWVRGVAF